VPGGRPRPVGECIGQIGHEARDEFAGYVDKAASEKKVLHDVFERATPGSPPAT
jgi:fatty-acyl-CoA synthase